MDHHPENQVSSDTTPNQASRKGPKVVTLNMSISDHLKADPTPPGGDDQGDQKSGYENSRGNACRGGTRSRTVFPAEVAEMIDLRTIALFAEMAPKTEWERFLVTEIARASVLVQVCGKRKDLDDIRVHKRIMEGGWEIDATRRLDRLIMRLPAEPQLMVRELERSKQGTEFLIASLDSLREVVATKNALDDIQRDILFTLLGVPHELRSGSKRVPPASDGRALGTLITKEVMRLEQNLVRTLNQLDREELYAALDIGSTYRDKTTRNLRSDESRNYKRLCWAKQMFDDVRNGTESVDHHRSRDEGAHQAPGARRSHPEGAKRSAPTPPAPSPPPAEDDLLSSVDDEPASSAPLFVPEIPEDCPDEIREDLLIFAGGLEPETLKFLRERMAAIKASAESEPPPPATA